MWLWVRNGRGGGEGGTVTFFKQQKRRLKVSVWVWGVCVCVGGGGNLWRGNLLPPSSRVVRKQGSKCLPRLPISRTRTSERQ